MAASLPTVRARRRVSSERRRRQRHFRRRRRDLLEDAVLGLVVAVVLISLTAGLGVLALLVVPLGLALIGVSVAGRVRVHRQGSRSARSPGARPRVRS